MWSFLVFVSLLTWAEAQHRSARQHQGPGYLEDIRLAVPGDPGSDYPTLGNIPRTSFSCSGKAPGYYADIETNCQAFRVCTSGSTYGFQSFLCPNGTLFNQAVFVCDWWMNVNCQKSTEFINSKNDKFGNLRLGPQLMKDIKKMITHPMRNPYDKTVMKSNLIVMQDYRPPPNPMFGALLQGAGRSPNSVHTPAKLIQAPYNQNAYNGNVFAASTPSPSYVPPAFNSISPSQRDAEVFQRQRQNGQYQQNGHYQHNDQYQKSGRLQNAPKTQISNGHTGPFSQQQNLGFSFNTGNSLQKPAQLYNTPAQFRQNQNFANTQKFNQQRGQYRQSGQYNDGTNQAQVNGKQSGFDISYRKQQYTAPSLSVNDNTGHVNTEAKQNLVSDETPATIVTKTLTFNRIVDPEPGKPKSRITIKTWIIKPTKSAKLIAEPSSYNYPRPTNPPPAKQVVETPYVYNPPTTAQSAKIIAAPEGYSYNRPTAAAKQVEGYVYDRPTVAAKIVSTVREAPRVYLPPTSPPPTVSSRLHLPPTTYKPAAKLYLPPSPPNVVLSRQYLAPSAIQQPAYYQNAKLQASPTTPTPVYAAPPDNPSFSLTKHSHIKSNHNNLTFADILTKEKLDITVNDIVSDTSKILQTASPQTEQYGQYRQEKDYSEETYLSSTISEDSDELLTPQSPTVVATSARLVAGPARELEPPEESYDTQNLVNTNKLANLPFYKEPETTKTIERTVSLKISIPEKVASYLFKSRNESDYDKLEILNTGSSNYLVLTNNILTNKNPGASFIPIGRLIADKTSNISDSQALVFNFLADSLNQAKEYSNIAKQNIVAPTPSQFQGVNNQELARITNQISQLTASQYANQNNYNHGNIVTQPNSNQYQSAKYSNGYPQNQQQNNPTPARLTSQQGYTYQNNGASGNLQLNPNQIYSGQLYKLPVPDVTSHYNAGPANLVQAQYLAPNVGSQNGNTNNSPKQLSSEVEIVQSQTLPIAPAAPAKLQQFTPSNEAETFNSHEHSGALLGNFLDNGNGISAQLQDKIVGTIPHPSEDNKLVTYKKDESYYVYTKLNNNINNIHANSANSQINNAINNVQSAKIIQGQPNIVFQFVPSVSYQLDDEREQQKILNAFQIDEFGSPKKGNQIQDHHRRGELISEVNYSIDHPQSAKQVNGQLNEISTLYAGPSSYSAPQASVGSLEAHQGVSNNLNARLELEDNHKFNGY